MDKFAVPRIVFQVTKTKLDFTSLYGKSMRGKATMIIHAGSPTETGSKMNANEKRTSQSIPLVQSHIDHCT